MSINRSRKKTTHEKTKRRKEIRMSLDHISNFIDFMVQKNCPPENPSEIRADNKWNDYQIAGDQGHKKKGYYILTVDADYVNGACGDRRIGETHQYWGKPTRALSDAERRDYARKMKENKEKKEKELQERHNKVAQKAQKEWDAGTPTPPDLHPYLNAKQITPEFTRIDDNNHLLIPMYADKRLWNVQSIDEEGTKLYKKHGRKKGCYCPLATISDSKDTLYICEGFATGKSIRKATGAMVLVAFDSGNLIHVAKDKRAENPDSRIVICADNDLDTVINGEHVNVGLKKAREASDAVNGVLLYPEFLDGDKGSDFNDFEKEYGEDALREYIEKNTQSREITAQPQEKPPLDWLNERPPIESYDDETMEAVSLYEDTQAPEVKDDSWRENLAFNDKGKLFPRSLVNVSLILEHSGKFKDMFCFDEFAQEKVMVQCPHWESPKGFKPRPITDEDITWLSCDLEKHGLTLGMQQIKKILDAVIMKKRRNPAKEYFSKLEWDGTPRLASWLSYYAGCEHDDPEYLAAVGTKFICAIVSRVMNPGCKFDHMPIFEGGQGVGKSTMLKTLATIHGKTYFDDTIKATDLGTDKVIPKMQGVLIIELAELTGLHKADMDNFKQQITIQDDRIVRKYANEASRLPRQFVLAGTVNPKDGYLDDPTGLRRFWPVKVGENIDMEALERDKSQLYAEAMDLYRQRYPLWMDKEMSEKLVVAQESRKLISPWLPDLEELSDNQNFVPQKEIWKKLGFETYRRNAKDQLIIGKIMTELGFEQARQNWQGQRERGWKRIVELD